MKEKEEKKEISPKDRFVLTSFRVCLEFGENGEEIVRMVAGYINEGWVDFDQAIMILKQIFEGKDD